MSNHEQATDHEQRVLRDRTVRLMTQLCDFCVPYFVQAFEERVRAANEQIVAHGCTTEQLKSLADYELSKVPTHQMLTKAAREKAILRRAEEIESRPKPTILTELTEYWFFTHVSRLLYRWMDLCVRSAKHFYPDSPRVYLDAELLPVEPASEKNTLLAWSAVVEVAFQHLVRDQEVRAVLARIKSEHSSVLLVLAELFEAHGIAVRNLPVIGC